MLANNKMPERTKEAMPGVGVQEREPLLAYQWHRLQWQHQKDLERKDGNLPFLRGFNQYFLIGSEGRGKKLFTMHKL